MNGIKLIILNVIFVLILLGCSTKQESTLNPKYFPNQSYTNGHSVPRYYNNNGVVIDRCKLLYDNSHLYGNVDWECKRKLIQLAHPIPTSEIVIKNTS